MYENYGGMDTCLGLYGTMILYRKYRYMVWNLYLEYGLGLGTPKLISCRVELRRTLRLLFMCVGKGLAAS